MRHLPVWERFLQTAYARYGAAPLCPADRECAALLEDESVLARVRAEQPLWCNAFLELSWRCRRMHAYPEDLVEPLCEIEQTGKEPFIQREVWRQLLYTLTSAYAEKGEPKTERSLLACRAHFKWRLERVDGIYAPLSRTNLESDDIFLREPLEFEGIILWKSKTGATLHVPSADPSWACFSEDSKVELVVAGAIAPLVYRSRVNVKSQGVALWKRRRGPAPLPFPDASGSSTPPSPQETDEEDTDKEKSDVERQEPAAQSVAAKSGTLSIYEQPLVTLPEGFRYVPRVVGEYQAMDSTGTLDIANDLLVTGMQKKRRLS